MTQKTHLGLTWTVNESNDNKISIIVLICGKRLVGFAVAELFLNFGHHGSSVSINWNVESGKSTSGAPVTWSKKNCTHPHIISISAWPYPFEQEVIASMESETTSISEVTTRQNQTKMNILQTWNYVLVSAFVIVLCLICVACVRKCHRKISSSNSCRSTDEELNPSARNPEVRPTSGNQNEEYTFNTTTVSSEMPQLAQQLFAPYEAVDITDQQHADPSEDREQMLMIPAKIASGNLTSTLNGDRNQDVFTNEANGSREATASGQDETYHKYETPFGVLGQDPNIPDETSQGEHIFPYTEIGSVACTHENITHHTDECVLGHSYFSADDIDENGSVACTPENCTHHTEDMF